MRNIYRLIHAAHCGMLSEIREDERREWVRKHAARELRNMRRKGFLVSTLERGTEWEITGRDDAATVSDYEGVLKIKAPREYECRLCGCDFIPDDIPTLPRYASCGCDVDE